MSKDPRLAPPGLPAGLGLPIGAPKFTEKTATPASAPRPPAGPSLPPAAMVQKGLSTRSKLATAAAALKLRDEALRHARGKRDENPLERDLINVAAHVIAEMRGDAARVTPLPVDPVHAEADRIKALRIAIERRFSTHRENVVRALVQETQERMSLLYLEDELEGRAARAEGTTGWPEQGLYRALQAKEREIGAVIAELKYANGVEPAEVVALFDERMKDLALSFLANVAPELELLLRTLGAELVPFLLRELPRAAGEIAWETVREARVGELAIPRAPLPQTSFAAFRSAFERCFLERLVASVQESWLERLEGKVREGTSRFASDARSYAAITTIVCEHFYDQLVNEGFLLLPTGWRARR